MHLPEKCRKKTPDCKVYETKFTWWAGRWRWCPTGPSSPNWWSKHAESASPVHMVDIQRKRKLLNMPTRVLVSSWYLESFFGKKDGRGAEEEWPQGDGGQGDVALLLKRRLQEARPVDRLPLGRSLHLGKVFAVWNFRSTFFTISTSWHVTVSRYKLQSTVFC